MSVWFWENLRRLWWFSAALAYVWFFAAYAHHNLNYPTLNWDMLGYVGAVESHLYVDPNVIYSQAMEEVHKGITDEQFKNISTYNPLSNNAKAFNQQLPFYKVKPLYNMGIWVLNKYYGMTMVDATYTLSVAGFILFGILCYFFRPVGMDPALWWLLVIWFAAFGAGPLCLIAGLSTPDMLCISFSLAGFLFWVYRRSAFWFGLCMIIAQLLRSDTMLLTLFLLALFTFDNSRMAPLSFPAALLIGWLSLVLYFIINYWAGDYGWRVLFHFKFIEKTAFPADQVPGFGWPKYLSILQNGVHHLALSKRAELLMLMSVVGTIYHIFLPSDKSFYVRALWWVWLAMAARFAFFPAWGETRYYYAYYYMMIYCLCEIFSPYLQRVISKYWTRYYNFSR